MTDIPAELLREFEDRYRKEKLYVEFVKFKEAQENRQNVLAWKERKCKTKQEREQELESLR